MRLAEFFVHLLQLNTRWFQWLNVIRISQIGKFNSNRHYHKDIHGDILKTTVGVTWESSSYLAGGDITAASVRTSRVLRKTTTGTAPGVTLLRKQIIHTFVISNMVRIKQWSKLILQGVSISLTQSPVLAMVEMSIRPSVCLSVYPSVTVRWHCVKTVQEVFTGG